MFAGDGVNAPGRQSDSEAGGLPAGGPGRWSSWAGRRWSTRAAPGTSAGSPIDTYAVSEAQDPAFATGFGDLSVHEVAMDPDTRGVAYLSYYAAGCASSRTGRRAVAEVASITATTAATSGASRSATTRRA